VVEDLVNLDLIEIVLGIEIIDQILIQEIGLTLETNTQEEDQLLEVDTIRTGLTAEGETVLRLETEGKELTLSEPLKVLTSPLILKHSNHPTKKTSWAPESQGTTLV
jgi:hypothetical protein